MDGFALPSHFTDVRDPHVSLLQPPPTCGVSSGRLLGKATIPLDLKGTEAKPAVLHSGWISIGKRGGKGSPAAAELRGRTA
jgi:hypothetical protein